MKTSIFSHCTDCHETQSHKPGRQAGFLHEYNNDTHLLGSLAFVSPLKVWYQMSYFSLEIFDIRLDDQADLSTR